MNVQTAARTPDQKSAPSIPAHLRRLVLTGFMGAGKTTVGRLLATLLGWDFLDLDAHVESRTGLSVPAIFATQGERRFRQLETECLASALGRDAIVLALGGGTPEVPANRLLLEQTPAIATIFLDAPFAVLYERCKLQALDPGGCSSPAQGRPVLADPAHAETRFLARLPAYRRLANYTIDTTTLTTEETVAALLHHVNAK